MRSIAIIGGGLSGTLTAIHLLKARRADIAEITIFEKAIPQIFRGVAYSNEFEYQPLNVRARNMSLFSDDEGHFLRWLEANAKQFPQDRLPETHNHAFVRRDIFGQYIADSLSEACRNAQQMTAFRVFKKEVTELVPDGRGYKIICSDSDETLWADTVVLALGNFPPADILPGNPIFANPWQSGALKNIQPNDTILLAGTGLTMVDVACSLHKRGHRGKIIAISRRGLLPRPHAAPPDCPLPLPPLPASRTVVALLAYFKDAIRTTVAKGYAWQSVFDRFRPQTQQVWHEMPYSEKRVFLRHFQHLWDVHRHRMPMQSAEIIGQMQRDGQLEIAAGRIRDARKVNGRLLVVWQPRSDGRVRDLPLADAAFNCTGPSSDLRKAPSQLVQKMLDRDLICPDYLRLGALTDADGQLLNRRGQAVKNIFAVGSLRKARLWESTALREIRAQAEHFAKYLNHVHHVPLPLNKNTHTEWVWEYV